MSSVGALLNACGLFTGVWCIDERLERVRACVGVHVFQRLCVIVLHFWASCNVIVCWLAKICKSALIAPCAPA